MILNQSIPKHKTRNYRRNLTEQEIEEDRSTVAQEWINLTSRIGKRYSCFITSANQQTSQMRKDVNCLSMVTLNVDKIQLLSLYKENYLTCKHTCESEMMENDFPIKEMWNKVGSLTLKPNKAHIQA